MRASTVRKKRKRTRDQRGAALIMVLLAIVVLTVFLTDVQQDASTTFSSAISARERLKAEYHARSAINLSRLLIAVEPSVRKTVQTSPMGMMVAAMSGGKLPQLPVWSFADQLLGAFNGGSGAESFASLASVDMSTSEKLGLKGGNFELVIVDEDSKININQAAQTNVLAADNVGMQLMGLMAGAQYDAFFDRLGADGQPADRQDDLQRHHRLGRPQPGPRALRFHRPERAGRGRGQLLPNVGLDYSRKNAAFDRSPSCTSSGASATISGPRSSTPIPAIQKATVTVWGQGTINVNSANPQCPARVHLLRRRPPRAPAPTRGKPRSS